MQKSLGLGTGLIDSLMSVAQSNCSLWLSSIPFCPPVPNSSCCSASCSPTLFWFSALVSCSFPLLTANASVSHCSIVIVAVLYSPTVVVVMVMCCTSAAWLDGSDAVVVFVSHFSNKGCKAATAFCMLLGNSSDCDLINVAPFKGVSLRLVQLCHSCHSLAMWVLWWGMFV